MNEIKRIHIAKVPFNIELTAKKTFDTYLQALEAAVHDAEVMMDIELRIAEILSDRGVKADGVIVADDVRAIIQQLGQPEEFADESPTATTESLTTRRLFRDTQNGMIGGVASGIATFAGINVMWVRLVLLIALLASFGTAILIYIVLWIVIPPVQSASDRLQLEGKPITIPAIQATMTRFGVAVRANDKVAVRLASLLLGIGFAVLAMGAIAATIAGGYGVLFHDAMRDGFYGVAGHDLIYSITALLVLSGILLAGLFTVLAYASFAQRITRRMTIASLTIIVTGLLSFGLGIGLMYHAMWQQDRYTVQHTKTTIVAVDGDIRAAVRMTVNAPGATVRYVVSKEVPKVTLRAFSDSQHRAPQPTVTVKDGLLSVAMNGTMAGNSCFNFMNCGQYELTLTGPALGEVTLKDGWAAYVSSTQPTLQATLADNLTLRLEGGTIGELTVMANRGSSLDGSSATIDRVLLTNQATSSVSLGTVKDLSISNSLSCPAYEKSSVSVSGISGILRINGQERVVASIQDSCLDLALPD